MSIFNVQLKPFEECMFPREKNGSQRVSWFWLTDSYYYLKFGEEKLFQLMPQQVQKNSLDSSYLDYYFIRFLEDFFEILPYITNPIPRKVFRYVNTADKWTLLERKVSEWYDSIGNTTLEQEEVYVSIAQRLLYGGHLGSGFVNHNAACRFYRVADKILVKWDFREKDKDGIKIWTAGKGEHEMDYFVFLDEVEAMLVNFFEQMDRQVQTAAAFFQKKKGGGSYQLYDTLRINNKIKGLDKSPVEYLLEEHKQKKCDFFECLTKVKQNQCTLVYETNWDWLEQSVRKILSC